MADVMSRSGFLLKGLFACAFGFTTAKGRVFGLRSCGLVICLLKRYMILFFFCTSISLYSGVSSGTEIGGLSGDKIHDYFVQALGLHVAKARLSKSPKIMLIKKLPSVSKVVAIGAHDARYDGIIMTYFNMVGQVTNTSFEFSQEPSPEGKFVFVIDETVRSWEDLFKLVGAIPASQFFESTFAVAKKQAIELHSCEYVPVYHSGAISGGLVFLNPKYGFAAGDICLYRAVFALVGFSAAADVATGHRDILLDLAAVRTLYSLEDDELGVNGVIVNLTNKYRKITR